MSHLSHEAKDLLARAHHADVPAPADRERNRLALQAAVGVLLPAGGAVAQGWLATALPRALAVLALASAAGVAVTHDPPPHADTTAHAAPRRAAPRAAHATPTAPPPVAPPTVAAPTRTTPPLPATVAAPVARRPSPRPAPAPAALARTIAPPPAAAPPAAPPVARDVSLAAQLRLLADAQAALRADDPARARALAAECRRRYPDGALATEVEAVSLLASCAAGNPSREAAARWLASAPRSPLAGRVRRACGVDAP